jgi:oligopeptide transport system substrate-binding protein
MLVTLLAGACGESPAPPAKGTGNGVGGESGRELHAVQVLRRGNGAEPQTLDPHRAEGVPESNILRDLFEGLVSESPDGELAPGAAESWTASEDGLVYTFRLRADGRWSNGDPVTAADFEFGLRRSIDPATLSRYSSILFPIVNAEAIARGTLPPEELGVTAKDDRTVEIRLRAPTPYLLGLLTHSTTYPVHRPSLQAAGERFARPGVLVGNGAYRLAEWVVQSHLRLERNAFYWDNAGTTIDEVWYYPLENQDAELKRYRAGELDITEALPYNQLQWVRENLADQLVISPYLGSYYYGLNLTRQPFADNPPLRTALAMAIDRDIITARVAGAGEIPAYGWVPPVTGYEGQRPPWAEWTQAEREDEARRRFAAAGYGPERPLRVEILYNTNENHKRIAVAIASMWKQVLGVQTSLVNQEWKVFLATRANRETQAFRAGWIGDYNDAYSFAQLMHSTNEQNDSGYASARYDALLDQAAAERDGAIRARLLQEAERVLLEDLPIIPIYFYVSKHLVKPWVGGFEPNIMDHHPTKDLYIRAH